MCKYKIWTNKKDRKWRRKNSEVFIARDLQLNAELFIKKISKNKLAEEGLDIENYFLEARLLYQGKHAHVAEIQYASEDEENIYLSMPVYKNGSLSSLIKYIFKRGIVWLIRILKTKELVESF